MFLTKIKNILKFFIFPYILISSWIYLTFHAFFWFLNSVVHTDFNNILFLICFLFIHYCFLVSFFLYYKHSVTFKISKKKKVIKKDSFLIVAEILDSYRIIPRIVIAGYSYLIYIVIRWFMNLPDPNNAQSALVSVLITAGAGIFSFYSKTGRIWNEQKK